MGTLCAYLLLSELLTTAYAVNFIPLEDLPDGKSSNFALGVSADGSVIMGEEMLIFLRQPPEYFYLY